MKKPRARLVAIAIAIAAAVAAASSGPGAVIATPSAKVVLVTTATRGSGMVSLQNKTMSTIDIVQFVRDPACTTTDPRNVVSIAPSSQSIAAMTASFEIVQCAGQDGSLTGMQRCMFHGLDGMGTDVLDFMGVCEYAGSAGLALGSTTLNFGNVAVGQTVAMPLAVTDTAAAQITQLSFQIDDIAGNFLVAAPCAMDDFFCDAPISQIGSGSGTTIMVECRPQTIGSHSAQLYIDTNDGTQLFAGLGAVQQTVALTCNAGSAMGPVLSIMPPSVTLAAQAGAGSAAQTLSLTNTGTGTITIDSTMITDIDPGASADWTAAPQLPCASLPCQVPVSIGVTFAPTAIGSREALLTIGYDDGASLKTAQVDLQGFGSGATLAYSGPAPIDFGVVPLNMTATVMFGLSNGGNEATTATMSIDQGPFVVSPNPQMVFPGTPVVITASCTPTAVGLATGHLSFAGSPLFGSPPATVDLRCTGTSSALFAVPSTLNVGEVRTNDATPVTHMFTLESAATGGQQLTLTGPPTLDMPNGNLSIVNVSGSVTPVTFGVTIMPNADGDLADHVDAMDTIGDTVQIPISGHVVTASYVAPSTLDLGTFCVNQPTTASTVALSSTGTATITVDQPTLAQGTSSAFQITAVTPPTYPAMLAPGASARLSVTPNRQSNAGQQNDVLQWTTDVSNMASASTQLAAHFIASGAAIAPTDLEFGSVPAHTGMATQSVKIQNCNTTQITLDTPKITPANSPFSVVGMVPQALGPGEATTFAVAFQPTTVDHFVATLTIDATDAASNTMTLTVMLVGDATGGGSGDAGPSTTPTPPTSFYACSCGSSGNAGGVIVALALAVVIVRRRRAPS